LGRRPHRHRRGRPTSRNSSELASRAPEHWLAQFEKELFEFIDVGVLVGTSERNCHELEPNPIQRTFGRRKLGHDLAAFRLLANKALNTTNLAF